MVLMVMMILLYKLPGMYNTFATPGPLGHTPCESFDNVVSCLILSNLIYTSLLLCTNWINACIYIKINWIMVCFKECVCELAPFWLTPDVVL